MKTSSALLALASVALVHGHSTVFNIWVNDVDQGRGDTSATNGQYIRSPPNNNPVKDVTSKDVRCNVNDAAVAKTIDVKPGDKITFEWHHNDATSSDDIIASSHLGPVMTYIAPTASEGDAAWVKLAEEGYDASTKTWAVTNLITNRGKHSVTLPDLTEGEYLLRPEIIALHEAENVSGAQLYMECVQIKVAAGGSVSLPSGVSFPGAYTANDAGILFDIYNGFTSYPIPGPAVWDGKSSGSASTAKASSAAATSTVKATAAASSSPVAAVSSVAAATSVAASKPTTAVVSSVAAAKPTTLATVVSSKAAAATTTAATASAVSSAAGVSPVTVYVTVTASASPCGETSAAASASSAPVDTASSGTVAKYGRCGGTGYTGSTVCASGSTCVVQNPYYSQCI